jgi:microcystin-dependent protein
MTMIFNTEANLTGSSPLPGQNVQTRGTLAILDKGNAEFFIMTLAQYGGIPPDENSADLSCLNTNVAVRMAVQVFPQGGIVMWSGGEGNIPEDWSLCDGTNGTPDLRDRFVIATGGLYSTGDTGGSSTISIPLTTDGHVLTEAEMPAHSHEVLLDHKDNVGDPFEAGQQRVGSEKNASHQLLWPSKLTGGSEAHNHTISAAAAGANLPPYYALAFIMRTGSAGVILNPVRPEGKLDYIGVNGVVDLDAQFGAVTVFTVKPNADITALNVINLPESSDSAYGAAIKIISDGASTVTFGTQFNFPANTPPTLSTDNDSYDWIATFTTDNGGVMDAELSISDLD